ncbi:MAG: hypothetical protein PUA52_02205 [Lachnospiraceae bacterium]|nr:hypothetical protein [Lachnospiraceae bacterium]
MMNGRTVTEGRPVRLGPLALLLTVIGIALTVLAVLTFSAADADLNLAEKKADQIRERYLLESDGQAFLASLTEKEKAAPESSGRTVEKDLVRGDLTLHIEAVVTEGKVDVTVWQLRKHWEEDTGVDLWSGS